MPRPDGRIQPPKISIPVLEDKQFHPVLTAAGGWRFDVETGRSGQ